MSSNIEQRDAFHGEEIRNSYERFASSYRHMEALSEQAREAMVNSIAQIPLEELTLKYNLRELFLHSGMISVPGRLNLMAQDEKLVKYALSDRLSELFVNTDGSNLIELSPTDPNRKMTGIVVTVPTEDDLEELPEDLLKFLRKISKLSKLFHNSPLVVSLRVHSNPDFKSAKTILP